jgi:beta-N-acetylhexosaminidase
MDVVSKNIGSFFMVSFPESAPGDETLYYLQDSHIGGLILFADHCRDQDSLKSWLADFKKTLNRPLLVAVDQEGGRVCRFTRGFPTLEAPRYYGHDRKLVQYRSDLARVCEKLYEIGVNINLVPTVDLLDTEKDHVLDTRTFSDDPDVVARFVKATIDIHRGQGLLTCAKHFPGLGRSRGDPHKILAASDLNDEDFRETELPPFRDAIEAGVDTVMVTHLSIPQVDDNPAIASNKIIGGWLKNQLDFNGAVITDDLLMRGASEIDSVPNLSVRSFAAGADLLLFGQELKKTREAFDRFSNHWDRGDFEVSRQEDSIKRVKTLMEKIVL